MSRLSPMLSVSLRACSNICLRAVRRELPFFSGEVRPVVPSLAAHSGWRGAEKFPFLFRLHLERVDGLSRGDIQPDQLAAVNKYRILTQCQLA
jgi:hypothetical protein